MFHVMLVLPALIVAAIAISILLFGIFILIASALSGASAALLIKNKAVKQLLLIGCGILTFGGILCVFPFVAIYAGIPELAITAGVVAALICMAVLAALGIKFASMIKKKVGKIILMVVFTIVAIAAASVAVFIPIIRMLLAAL